MTCESWHDKVAVITGGASGLGLAVARRLARHGVKQALLDLSQEKLDAAAHELDALAFSVDVTSQEQIESVVESVVKRHGGVHLLINSAGITGRTNLRSHEVDPADFERVMQINVRGSFITARAVLPHMLRQDWGRILHIASIAGKEGNAGMLAYSTSKAAVIGMTKVMGKEYAETGITVNAIAPAVIRTELVDAMPAEQVSYMTDKIPMKRCGTLDELAALAEFILSPEASFTTGFTWDLTGGRATY